MEEGLGAQGAGDDVPEQLRRVFDEIFRPSGDADVTSSSFRRGEAETWDSVNHMRLVAAVEKAFHRRLNIDQVLGLETYDDALHIVADENDQATA